MKTVFEGVGIGVAVLVVFYVTVALMVGLNAAIDTNKRIKAAPMCVLPDHDTTPRPQCGEAGR